MKSCPKCSGPMTDQPFYTDDGIWWGWHCMICGEILDRVIALHRKISLNRRQRMEQRRTIFRTIEWTIR